jgi:hypothetical protein
LLALRESSTTEDEQRSCDTFSLSQMTGNSNEETVDNSGTNNADTSVLLPTRLISSTTSYESFGSTTASSFGSTTSTAMAGNNTSSLSRKERVSIPKRSLLDDDDEEEDEQEDYNVGSTTTTNPPLVLTAAEHNNGRPPLHFKPRFSLALAAVAQDDDNDDDDNTNTNSQQGSSSSNRRRHTLSTATIGTATATGSAASSNKHYAWDDFVRQGTRLKTFLDDAMHHVKKNTTKLVGSKRQRSNSDGNDAGDDDNDNDDGDDDSPRPLRRRRVEENDYTAELAREKTEQVMLLQRVSECEYEVNGCSSALTRNCTQCIVSQCIDMLHCEGRHLCLLYSVAYHYLISPHPQTNEQD